MQATFQANFQTAFKIAKFWEPGITENPKELEKDSTTMVARIVLASSIAFTGFYCMEPQNLVAWPTNFVLSKLAVSSIAGAISGVVTLFYQATIADNAIQMRVVNAIKQLSDMDDIPEEMMDFLKDSPATVHKLIQEKVFFERKFSSVKKQTLFEACLEEGGNFSVFTQLFDNEKGNPSSFELALTKRPFWVASHFANSKAWVDKIHSQDPKTVAVASIDKINAAVKDDQALIQKHAAAIWKSVTTLEMAKFYISTGLDINTANNGLSPLAAAVVNKNPNRYVLVQAGATLTDEEEKKTEVIQNYQHDTILFQMRVQGMADANPKIEESKFRVTVTALPTKSQIIYQIFSAAITVYVVGITTPFLILTGLMAAYTIYQIVTHSSSVKATNTLAQIEFKKRFPSPALFFYALEAKKASMLGDIFEQVRFDSEGKTIFDAYFQLYDTPEKVDLYWPVFKDKLVPLFESISTSQPEFQKHIFKQAVDNAHATPKVINALLENIKIDTWKLSDEEQHLCFTKLPPECYPALKKAGFNIDARDKDQNTPLMTVVAKNDYARAQGLVSKGADKQATKKISENQERTVFDLVKDVTMSNLLTRARWTRLEAELAFNT